jgi:phage-related tail fiber protein
MSHFTAIKTQIKQIPPLLQALADLGFSEVEVHDAAQHLFGFRGDVRSQTAEVIIRRQYVGVASNDIGFQRQADGTFTAIISDYDQQTYSAQWLNQLTQRYGYHLLKATAPQQGFTVETEQVLEDGTIRLVVGRWV